MANNVTFRNNRTISGFVVITVRHHLHTFLQRNLSSVFFNLVTSASHSQLSPSSVTLPLLAFHKYSSAAKIHASLSNCCAIDAFRKGRGCRLWSTLSPCKFETQRGEKKARGTSLLCALADCIWGTLGWKCIKTPGEAFHLPLCRYSGMAEMSAETPQVLLSFSCSVRTRGGKRGRKWCRGAKAKFVSSAKTLFYHDTPRLTNLTGNNWFCPFSQKAAGSGKQWRVREKRIIK